MYDERYRELLERITKIEEDQHKLVLEVIKLADIVAKLCFRVGVRQ